MDLAVSKNLENALLYFLFFLFCFSSFLSFSFFLFFMDILSMYMIILQGYHGLNVRYAQVEAYFSGEEFQINHFLQPNSTDIFLISSRKHMFWYSLEAPRRGIPNYVAVHEET